MDAWTWYADAVGCYSVGVTVTDEKQSKEIVIPFVIEKRPDKIVETPLMKGKDTKTWYMDAVGDYSEGIYLTDEK